MDKSGPSHKPARGRAGSNFLCHAAQSFGKEWETVCVSGLTRAKATTKKAKKENLYENVNENNHPGSDYPRAALSGVFTLGFPPTAVTLGNVPGMLSSYVTSFAASGSTGQGAQPATHIRLN